MRFTVSPEKPVPAPLAEGPALGGGAAGLRLICRGGREGGVGGGRGDITVL